MLLFSWIISLDLLNVVDQGFQVSHLSAESLQFNLKRVQIGSLRLWGEFVPGKLIESGYLQRKTVSGPTHSDLSQLPDRSIFCDHGSYQVA